MTSVTLTKIKVHFLKINMKNAFKTSTGYVSKRRFMIIEANDFSGAVGFGECVAFETPWYTPETQASCLAAMSDYLIPKILSKQISHPDNVFEYFSFLSYNHMAKAAIEGAIWDLYAKKCGVPLSIALGGSNKGVDVGISIGLQKSDEYLLSEINHAVKTGYKRIKIKVEKNSCHKILQKVRDRFPDIPLMIDANGTYSVSEIDDLVSLDKFNLMMIEQPFVHDDFHSHALLQSKMNSNICLDESINSFETCVRAINLGASKVIAIKPARVGGLSQAKKIHDYCFERGIPVWCGGMLESGVGRSQNIALSTLPGFIIPGDMSPPISYLDADIIDPCIEVINGRVNYTSFHTCLTEIFAEKEPHVFEV